MMAAPPDPVQSRKRVATYGKSRKRLPSLSQVSPQKHASYTGDLSSHDGSSLDSTPRISPEQLPPSTDQSRIPTPKRPRSADVFDIPSSDEEEMPGHTVNLKRTTNIHDRPTFAAKNDGQRRINPIVDAKRRKIEPATSSINSHGSQPISTNNTLARPVITGENRSKSISTDKYKSKVQPGAPTSNRPAVESKQPSTSQPNTIVAPQSVPMRKKLPSPKPKTPGNDGRVQQQRSKSITKASIEATKERKIPLPQPSTIGLSPSKSTARPPSTHDKIPSTIRKAVSVAKTEKPAILRHNTAPISATAKALLKPDSSIYDFDESSADETAKPRKAAPIIKPKRPIASPQKPPVSTMERLDVKTQRSAWNADELSADKIAKPRKAAPIIKPQKLAGSPQKPAVSPQKLAISLQKPPVSAAQLPTIKAEHRTWDVEESSDDDTLMIPAAPPKQMFTIPILDRGPQRTSMQNPSKEGSNRRRLIDSFAEPFARSFDARSSSSSESEDEDEDEDESVDTPVASQTESQRPIIHQSHSFEDHNMERIETSNTGVGESSSSQARRPRMTYGSSRSMLADQAMDFNTPMFTDLEMDDATKRRARRAVVPTLKPLQNMHEDSDGLDDSQGKADIRSLHELKQAGAKSRILTSVEHLLADIGVPGKAAISQRRSGLLDLSTRLLDKDFRREFLENGLETGLFVHLGMEEDIIAGFMLTSSLLVCLHDSFRPHTVQQLRQQGLARLLIRQIDKTSSVRAISKERSSNMSKIAQQLLAEYQVALLQAEVWEDTKPEVITPRAIALRCLELTVRKTREAGIATDVMSKELSSKLFSILQSFDGEVTNNANPDSRFVEFQLALSTLNAHSVRAMTNRDEQIWITDYLPIIANVLQKVLSNTEAEFGPAQVMALGLTINVTNNNPKACDCFANKDLLRAVGNAIVKNFDLLSQFLIEDERLKIVDNVIMTLGVFINFAEWSEAARLLMQSFKDTPGDPLEQFIRIFLENQAKTAEANSIEETHQNVAFGYLAVLLGYLSISTPILRRIQQAQPNRTLRPLISSIEEFISYWKQVDDQMIRGDDDGQEPTQGLVNRLQHMVDHLKAMSSSPLRA